MNRKPISRRTLLRGSFGAAMALPWLEAMAPAAPLITSASSTIARKTAAGPPVRMAFLYVPNGMHMQDWTPKGPSEKKFELQKIMEPISDFRDQMNVFTGLTLDGAFAHGDGGGDHARSVASFLTGSHPKKTNGDDIRNGQSVDQVAAERIGHLTRLKSLELGTEDSAQAGQCDSGYSCLYTSNVSWRTERSPLAKEVNPASVFDRLFGTDDGPQLDPRTLARKERDRKSVLDFVGQEAKILSNNLGVQDKSKLEEYLYAVRDIERRLASTDKLDENERDVPDAPRPVGVPAEFGAHVKLLFDMMTLAFQTDSTRVISFMYSNAGSNRPYKNLSIKDGHHNISHHGGSREKQANISKINHYHVTLLRHLLTRLSTIQEGGGSLLDNCMILYGSGIADGNSHTHKDLPICMFGGGGGSIKTGRHLRLRSGTPLTNLHRSMLDRVGASVDKFSDSNGKVDLS
jgi:hypothetical protein